MLMNPKTLSDWLRKLRVKVMTGPPGNRMRDGQAKIPDLDELVFEYVVTSNVFLMKLAWQGRNIELELGKKRGQASIRDFHK